MAKCNLNEIRSLKILREFADDPEMYEHDKSTLIKLIQMQVPALVKELAPLVADANAAAELREDAIMFQFIVAKAESFGARIAVMESVGYHEETREHEWAEVSLWPSQEAENLRAAIRASQGYEEFRTRSIREQVQNG